MTPVGIFDAKNRLSELVERASRGEEIVITRRGAPVARLMPPVVEDAKNKARRLVANIRQEREGQDQPGDGASLRTMIVEGRR